MIFSKNSQKQITYHKNDLLHERLSSISNPSDARGFVSSRAVVLDQGPFWAHLGPSGDTFGDPIWGRVLAVVEARGAATHPERHRTAPTTDNDPVQNVSIAKAEKRGSG